jgi:hypothetical protein
MWFSSDETGIEIANYWIIYIYGIQVRMGRRGQKETGEWE